MLTVIALVTVNCKKILIPFLFLVSDVSHLDFLFGTASGIVERSLPSCEHTHLKDRGEEDQG